MGGRNPLRHKGQHNRQGCSLCGLMKGNRGRRMEEGRKWVENSACNYAKGKWRKNKKLKNESPTNYGKKRKFQTGNGGSKNFVMGTSQFLLHTFLFLHFSASYCSRSSALFCFCFCSYFCVCFPFCLLCWQQQFLQFLKFFYGPAANGVVIKFLT